MKASAKILPREEWPYEVPENWVWTFLQDVCVMPITDGTHKTPTYCNANKGFPFISSKDVTSQHINWDNIKYITPELHDELYARLAPQIDDILLAKNGTTGVAALVETNRIFDIYVTLAIIRSNQNIVIPKYMFFLINSPVCKQQFDEHLTGIGLPNLHLRDIKATIIPLPPLPEQQRIIARIESLFSKLDAAAGKIRSALDSFDMRKAAILHKAFTGELTKKWRKENGVGMESWKTTTLGNCGEWSGGGTPSMKHPEYWENANIRWVTAKDMKIDTILDTQMHINSAGEENSSAKLIQGTALLFVTRSGILRRMFPVAMIDGEFTVNQDLKVLKPNDEFDTKYLLRACQAGEQRILNECMKSGTTVESINFSALKNFSIPVCSIGEQKEIVRVLDAIFARERAAKETAERLLEKIALTKKSILARAFRGALGTNDPTEESAEKALLA